MDRTTYGLDIAKNVMQLHWIEAETGEIGRKKLARAKLTAYFAELQPVRIVMEACGSAHHWARVFTGLGHQVELLPAAQVRPFVRSNKDDAADARAIWLAAQHSDIRRVPQKSVEQQGVLALHRTRSHWISVRTATVNSLRGLLYEFGAAIDEQIPATMRALVDGQLQTLAQIGERIDALERQIAALQQQLTGARELDQVPGIGVLGSTALAATLGDAKAWRSGRRQGASGPPEQARRPVPAHAANPRRALRDRARQGQAQVARAVAGAPPGERGVGGAGQQDGTHGLGARRPWSDVSAGLAKRQARECGCASGWHIDQPKQKEWTPQRVRESSR